MTRGRAWLPGAGSGRLAVLFAAVVAPPALALVWLGWQFVQHDRSLLRQREDERRQIDATAIVQSLSQSLADAERHLTDGDVPNGMVRFISTPEGMSVEPADRLLWHGDPGHLRPIESEQFAEAERLELRDNRPDQARVQYERWSTSADPGSGFDDGSRVQLSPDGRTIARHRVDARRGRIARLPA